MCLDLVKHRWSIHTFRIIFRICEMQFVGQWTKQEKAIWCPNRFTPNTRNYTHTHTRSPRDFFLLPTIKFSRFCGNFAYFWMMKAYRSLAIAVSRTIATAIMIKTKQLPRNVIESKTFRPTGQKFCTQFSLQSTYIVHTEKFALKVLGWRFMLFLPHASPSSFYSSWPRDAHTRIIMQ